MANSSARSFSSHPSRLHTKEQWEQYDGTPVLRRTDPRTLRAAMWAWRTVRAVARDLPRDGVATVVAPPPALPAGARRGVHAVLRRRSPTCLERCLVDQAWLAAQGVPCEVVVGVARTSFDVTAHAWLDIEGHSAVAGGYREIHRLGPR